MHHTAVLSECKLNDPPDPDLVSWSVWLLNNYLNNSPTIYTHRICVVCVIATALFPRWQMFYYDVGPCWLCIWSTSNTAEAFTGPCPQFKLLWFHVHHGNKMLVSMLACSTADQWQSAGCTWGHQNTSSVCLMQYNAKCHLVLSFV